MKTKTAGIAFALIVVTTFFSSGFGQRTSETKQRDKAERKLSPFDPRHGKDENRKHFILVFSYGEDSMLHLIRAEERLGSMPYKPATGGDFSITYSDSEKKFLGSYTELNPFVTHSCDKPDEPPRKIEIGTERIFLTPYNLKIHFLVLEDNKTKRRQEFMVGPVLKKAGIRL